MDYVLNDVAFAKKMLRLGYSQKQISMILKRPQKWVNRVARGETYSTVKEESYVSDRFLDTMKQTLDQILELRELQGAGELTDMDRAYILLLKECGVKIDAVRVMYADRSIEDVNEVWYYEVLVLPTDFDASLIGLDDKLVKTLISKIDFVDF